MVDGEVVKREFFDGREIGGWVGLVKCLSCCHVD